MLLFSQCSQAADGNSDIRKVESGAIPFLSGDRLSGMSLFLLLS